jgi:uncharacterized protein YegP (UPF0339 family)
MTYFYYEDADDQWRWRLRADNQEIIATSGGDGYKNKQDCLHGIKLVKSSQSAQELEVKS